MTDPIPAESAGAAGAGRGVAPAGALRRALTWPFLGAIYVYRVTLGPVLGGHCRFHPTCSTYALEAYRTHGPVRGTWLTVRRLARCHPLGGSGFDPVPPPARGAQKRRKQAVRAVDDRK